MGGAAYSNIPLENLLKCRYATDKLKESPKDKFAGAIKHLQPISGSLRFGVSGGCDTARRERYNRVKSSSVLIRPQA